MFLKDGLDVGKRASLLLVRVQLMKHVALKRTVSRNFNFLSYTELFKLNWKDLSGGVN